MNFESNFSDLTSSSDDSSDFGPAKQAFGVENNLGTRRNS
jgi:hypothetical protein